LTEKLGIPQVASGDLFRQAVERNDELGTKVKDFLSRGVLVPDEITIGMILERVAEEDCKRGAILDGFPRNIKQAEALDAAFGKQNKAIDRALYIEVAEDELVRRLSERRVCRKCQAPYQCAELSPEEGDRCPRCGGELYQRPDDKIETVKKRLEVYFEQTMPLMDYYRQQGKLLEVNGQGSVADVTDSILEALRRQERIAR
jgi:adenylate kinase